MEWKTDQPLIIPEDARSGDMGERGGLMDGERTDEAGRKLERLRSIIGEMESMVVAFSGGVDSTFLAREANRVLGQRSFCVTIRSTIHPEFEAREAAELVRTVGLRHRFVDADVLSIPEVRGNSPDRCYHCKRALFSELSALAAAEGLSWVADGTNLDDDNDYRPGMKALAELGIRSPLREAGLTKGDIRELSRRADLPTWDKPAYACLATRIPYGRDLTPEALRMVEQGEAALRGMGFRRFRLRHHDDTARIEIAPEELDRALTPGAAAQMVGLIKPLGYTYVSLDLEGYRSGSMNASIDEGGT
jgi:uncharacterized protein